VFVVWPPVFIRIVRVFFTGDPINACIISSARAALGFQRPIPGSWVRAVPDLHRRRWPGRRWQAKFLSQARETTPIGTADEIWRIRKVRIIFGIKWVKAVLFD
jgi:hypothetical protein